MTKTKRVRLSERKERNSQEFLLDINSAVLDVSNNKAMRQTTMAEAKKFIETPSPFPQRGSIGGDLKEAKSLYDNTQRLWPMLNEYGDRPD